MPIESPWPSEPVEASTPGEPLHVGVAFERAAQLPEGHDLVVREVAGLRQRRVEHRRRMPLGEDEPVAVGPVRVLGVVPEEPAEIEGRHDLGRRQRAAGMPRAGLGRHPQDVFPDRLGPRQQGVKVVGHRCFLLDVRARGRRSQRAGWPARRLCDGLTPTRASHFAGFRRKSSSKANHWQPDPSRGSCDSMRPPDAMFHAG